ncbi:MAG: ExbD/TolR family protein [Bdellovibrionia bacterium]
MQQEPKKYDFELNLIPFIGFMSVCICFLLMTAVWIEINTLNVKQAVGGQSVAETEKKPIMWVFMETDGSVGFDVKDAGKLPAGLRKFRVAAKEGAMDLEAISQYAAELVLKEPGLKTALIQPKAQTNYEDIISIMDSFKKSGLGDLGVVPL